MNRWIARSLFIPSFMGDLAMVALTRREWWSRIDDSVIMGALPLPMQVGRLSRHGVRHVINMCDEYGGPWRSYRRFGIEQLRLPTPDYTPPTLENVRRALAFIRAHGDSRHPVYVHCKSGRGRSATVALCWLISEHGITPPEAEALLLKRRPAILACWELTRAALPHRFLAEAAAQTGRADPTLASLFDVLLESVEITALQRGAERWAPRLSG